MVRQVSKPFLGLKMCQRRWIFCKRSVRRW